MVHEVSTLSEHLVHVGAVKPSCSNEVGIIHIVTGASNPQHVNMHDVNSRDF